MELKGQRKIQALALFTATCLIGDSMLYIVLPIYWRSVGLTAFWQVGVLLSLNRLVRFITNPLVGLFYQRYQIRTGLFLSMIMTTLVTIGYTTSRGFVVWCILRIIWGSTWSFLRIGALSTITLVGSENRGQMVGMYNGLYRIGSLVGTLIGGISAPILGIRGISLMILPLPLFSFSLLKSFERVKILVTHTKIKMKFSQQFSFSFFMILLNGFLISMIFQGIFTSTLSISISDNFNKNIPLLGMTFSAVFISGFIQSARWAWEPFLAVRFGKWTDGSFGRLPLQTFLLIFSGLGFFCITGVPSIRVFILFSLFVLATATGLTTTSDSVATDYSRRRLSVNILSLYSAFQDIGAAVGPMLGYFLISIGGSRLAYSTTGIILLCLSILWIIVIYTNRNNRQSKGLIDRVSI